MQNTHVDEELARARILHNRIPARIAAFERRRVAKDEEGRLGTRQGDVHAAEVL